MSDTIAKLRELLLQQSKTGRLRGLLDQEQQSGMLMTNYGSPDINMGFGKRNLDGSNKGLGFFGQLPNATGGTSTEISSFDDMARGEYPLMVPTLSQEEMLSLLNGNATDAVYQKAARHAEYRKILGQSPFAGYGEQNFTLKGLLK